MATAGSCPLRCHGGAEAVADADASGGGDAAYVRRVGDEEEEAIRGIDEDGEGPDVPPLCPRCRGREYVFWTSDNKACPLCTSGGRSGSWVICDVCAAEAEVCVFDAAPLDGSSQEAVPWLSEVVAVARREREEGQFGKRRGTGHSRDRDGR